MSPSEPLPAAETQPVAPMQGDAGAQSRTSGLSLESLLNRDSWNLPGWRNNEPVPIHSSETLDQLDLSLALLARYRNSLRPFHRLTSDILLTIFSEIHAAYSDPYGPFFGSYAFMSFARVCHTWRDLTQGTPMFWKQISTRFPAAALAALERSGEGGVYVVMPEDGNKDTAKQVLEAVSKHVHRLQKLYLPSSILKDAHGIIDPILLPLIHTPAPLLETLSTEKCRGEGDCIPMPVLFAGQTPRLSKLHIQYMRPLGSSVTLSNMRDLSFCGKKKDEINMSISELLDLVEACPLLEILQIKKVKWTPAADDDARVVRMEHLRLLDIGRTDASITSEIIRRLDATECALRLRVYINRYEDTRFLIGLPPAEKLGAGHYLHHIRKLHINFYSSYDSVVVVGQTATLPFEIHGVLDDDTQQNMGDLDVIGSTVYKSIIPSLDLGQLEEFAVSEMRSNTRWTGYTKQVWRDTFAQMPQLKAFHVTMNNCFDEGFSRAILSALSAHDDRHGAMLCPLLESVDVIGDKTWSSLQCYTMAEDRHKAGHPLKRVSMCLPHYASFDNPDDTDLPLLRRYVEAVDLLPKEIEFSAWPDHRPFDLY